MDLALCTIDGVVYNAQIFSALPPAELERKRRALVCNECGGPAFFRRQSTSGQAACFGARPHDMTCRSAAPEPRVIIGELEVVEARENPGDHIVVDMQYGSAQTANVVPGGRGGLGSPRGNRYFATGNGGRQALAHRRPSTLLRRLIDEPGFSNSQQIIEVPGRGSTTVRELFVHFTTIDEDHVPTFHGYWGFISDAKQGPDGEIWLNTTESWRDFSVLVPADLAARFVARFNVHDLEDLAGAYVLVFEHLSRSQSGKLYVALTELDTMSVYQP